MADLPTLHRALLCALDEIEMLVAQPQLDRVRLSRVRLTISKLAGECRIEADRTCRDRSRGGSRETALLLEALRISTIDARLEYTRHVGTWSLARVEQDWTGYCSDSVKLARRFRQQIAAEQALLCSPAAEAADPLALSHPRGYMGRQLPNQDIGALHGHPPRPHLR